MPGASRKKVAVVAVGGNSLIKDKAHRSIPDQYAAAAETMNHIAGMVEAGWDVVVTHGNGPQSWPCMNCIPFRWITAGRIHRGRLATCSREGCITNSAPEG